MTVDLHAHYPIHLLATEPFPTRRIRIWRKPLRNWIRGPVLRLANRIGNYPGRGTAPAATIQTLVERMGSDQDGFIKPTLPGLETPQGYDAVEGALRERYGADIADWICGGNARRVLAYWKGGEPGSSAAASSGT